MFMRVKSVALCCLAIGGGAVPALADGHCPDFGFSSAYLNEFFCRELEELRDGEPVTPTRNYAVPDPETQEFIDDLVLVQEAYQADPRSTLDLLNRIRSAGGTTAE